MAELLENLDENPKDWIALDIGCGTGRVLKHLSQFVNHVYGIDVSAAMIELALESMGGRTNVHLQVSSGKDLSEFDDCMFNLVYSIGVFQHIPRSVVYKDYFPEVYRVLRPGGYFIFTVPWRRTLFGRPLTLLKIIGYGYLKEGRRFSLNFPEGEPRENDFFSTRFYGKKKVERQLRAICFRNTVMRRRVLRFSDQLWVTTTK
jgi:ubiquinone/menaquinone biosynthesis C-methylase UbiE